MLTANIEERPGFGAAPTSFPAVKTGLTTEATVCCICDTNRDSELIASGEDFEYRTSSDEFAAFFCRRCRLVYLNPRPVFEEFERIYPPNYHAFEFSEKEFGLVFKVRRRLEARRLLGWCKSLPDDARIIDIGCGDGFHLELLRDFGSCSWLLEGVDADPRAASRAERKGLKVHCGLLENLNVPTETYDLAIMLQTVEHVAEPARLLRDVRAILKPGGRVVMVTDNIDSPDFHIFKKRHWGGYHFPRHWNLFSPSAIEKLAEKVAMEVETQVTQVSPVNWTYSIHNYLTDRKAPSWLINRFSLKSTVSLGIFTIFDAFHSFFGRGALINAILKRPA